MGTYTRTFSESTTEGKSRSIYYDVWGSDAAIAVVFTHGFALDHETWRRQVETLSDTHRTLAWDVSGCGGSAETSDPGRFVVASQTLLNVLDEEGIDQAVFVRQSMGSLLNQIVCEIVFDHWWDDVPTIRNTTSTTLIHRPLMES